MSAEETLIQIRREKHQELNGGTYPLAYSGVSIYSVLHIMQHNPPPISLDPTQLSNCFLLNGRITNLRKSGGITFIKIADTSGAVQLIATKNVLNNYDHLKLLDLGDIIEVEGYLCMSKTNEASVLIMSWTVLTKSHRPPPEKFVGIADQEIKYRKRYLDLMSDEETRARFIVRSYIMRAIRNYMENKGFMEVETSTLNTVATGANAKPFTTHHNALDIDLQLRIAPELYLKRLLVGGYSKVYEIGRNYRNEGIDTRHNPEFTMMESYEAYGRFSDLLVMTKALLRHIRDYLCDNLPINIQQYFQVWDTECPFSLSQFVEITMFEAVIKGMRKASLDNDSSHTLAELSYLDSENPRLQKIDQKAMMHELDQCQSEGQRIAILFEHVVEPFLAEDYRTEDGRYSLPVFITEYPKDICPLARAKDSDPEVCDRFELFVEGRELANAFQELNDPDEQARRFKEQLKNNQKDPMDYDADYIEALEYGLPPCIGFGMGLDRLCALLTGTSNIKDVILFPTLKPIR